MTRGLGNGGRPDDGPPGIFARVIGSHVTGRAAGDDAVAADAAVDDRPEQGAARGGTTPSAGPNRPTSSAGPAGSATSPRTVGAGGPGATSGEAPAGPAGGARTSRLAPWRAAARLASRDVRRRPWRSVLVGVLVGLPVAAVASGSIVFRTLDLSPADSWRQDVGQSDAVLTWTPGNPIGVTDAKAQDVIHREYPDADTVVMFSRAPDGITDADGRLHQVDVADPPLRNTSMLDGSIEVTHGRAPERSGEAAVTASVLRASDAHVGDELELLRGGRVRVTGVLTDMRNYNRDLVVTYDPPTAHPDLYRAAYVSIPGVDGAQQGGISPADDAEGQRLGIVSVGRPAGTGKHDWQVAVGYVIGGVALLMVAIVASAAFAVGARRQLRQLGIVSAAGGSPADLQRAVLLQGTVTGVMASLAGLAVAVIGTAAAHPLFDHIARRGVGDLVYRPGELLLAVLLGTASATAAAWFPARSAGRLPTLAALAGRRPPARLPVAAPVLGVLAIAAGTAVLATWPGSSAWLLGLAGAVMVVLGATAVAPLVVSLAEPLARRLRRGGRLAARGLARQRLRSAAVVAAVMAPVGVTILVACSTVTNEAREKATWKANASSGEAPRDNEVLYLSNGTPAEGVAVDLEAIRDIVPGAEEVPVRAAVIPNAPANAGYAAAVRVTMTSPGAGGGTSDRYLIINDREHLTRAGASPETVDAFEAGAVVVPGDSLRPAGYSQPVYPEAIGSRRPAPWHLTAEQHPTVVGVTAALAPEQVIVDPGVLAARSTFIAFVSQDTAERWGAAITDIGAYFTADSPLTDRQVSALRNVTGQDNDAWMRQYLRNGVATPAGSGEVEAGASGTVWHDDSLPARVLAVGASLLVTLAVVAVALALTAAESADEDRLLEAIGSPPSIRRSVSAWQATLLPAMAVVLAVPIALLVAGAVFTNANRGFGPTLVVPWTTVGAIVVLLPLVSGGATWIGATFTGHRRRDLAAAVVGGD